MTARGPPVRYLRSGPEPMENMARLESQHNWGSNIMQGYRDEVAAAEAGEPPASSEAISAVKNEWVCRARNHGLSAADVQLGMPAHCLVNQVQVTSGALILTCPIRRLQQPEK